MAYRIIYGIELSIIWIGTKINPAGSSLALAGQQMISNSSPAWSSLSCLSYPSPTHHCSHALAQRFQGDMAFIRHRAGHQRARKFTLPGCCTRLCRGDKVLKGDRLHRLPQPGARTSIIRNAGLCADAGAGEKDAPGAPAQQRAEMVKFLLIVHHSLSDTVTVC